MSKSSYLLKNTGILAIGNFSSKLLILLLVPIYTAALTTVEYGSYDIIYNTVTLLIPILTFNISDAMLRFPLEEGEDVPRIARTGIGLTLASGIVVLVCQLIPGAPWSELDGSNFIAALYISNALYQLLLLLARGSERMIDVAVAGVVSSVFMLTLNILLLIVLHWGLRGFFIANIAGMASGATYLLFRMRDIVFAPSRTRGGVILARMIRYSLPLAMTIIGWWFINTSGRYIVAWQCGLDANGLYSIAFKLPAILSTIAGIFIQAWQVSAIKEFDSEDSDGFLLNTFNTIEMLPVLLCSAMVLASPLMARVMFSGEFFAAWVYVPFLLVLAVFNTMGGMWGPFFSAKFDTGPLAASTFLGGVLNILLGIPLAMEFGVWGMIVANVAAGIVNWAYRGIRVRKHIHVEFHMLQSLAIYAVICLQGVIMILEPVPLGVRLLVSSAGLFGLLGFYRKNLFCWMNSMMDLIRARKAKKK